MLDFTSSGPDVSLATTADGAAGGVFSIVNILQIFLILPSHQRLKLFALFQSREFILQ